jgi:hypothetical protein
MAIPAGYFYKDGFYWGLDETGPYVWNGVSMALVASGGGGYLGEVADETAMIALSNAVAGDEVYRTDTGTYWKLREAPYSTASNWDELSPTAPQVQSIFFNGATTGTILFGGPGTVYGVFLTTSVVGTVRITDSNGGPDILASTVTAAASNVQIPVGTPPTYGVCADYPFLIVTGANVGYVVFGEAGA